MWREPTEANLEHPRMGKKIVQLQSYVCREWLSLTYTVSKELTVLLVDDEMKNLYN